MQQSRIISYYTAGMQRMKHAKIWTKKRRIYKEIYISPQGNSRSNPNKTQKNKTKKMRKTLKINIIIIVHQNQWCVVSKLVVFDCNNQPIIDHNHRCTSGAFKINDANRSQMYLKINDNNKATTEKWLNIFNISFIFFGCIFINRKTTGDKAELIFITQPTLAQYKIRHGTYKIINKNKQWLLCDNVFDWMIFMW